MLKLRFTIFKFTSPFPYRTQSELVLVCVGLHNFLRKECRSDEFSVEPDNGSSSSSSLPVNEEEFEQVFQTREQQRESANQWKASIVAEMWENARYNANNEQ
ncbi:hypothetical protein ACOSQ3_021382 [Xanthoceras sorbifolium]